MLWLGTGVWGNVVIPGSKEDCQESPSRWVNVYCIDKYSPSSSAFKCWYGHVKFDLEVAVLDELGSSLKFLLGSPQLVPEVGP